MKILASESFTADGYSVYIHISPTAPSKAELYYFSLDEVLATEIYEDAVNKKGTVEYTASVFKRHLPEMYAKLKEHSYDVVLCYNVDFY